MTKLFNKGGDGAGEIVRVLGLIDNDLDFGRTTRNGRTWQTPWRE